MAAPTYTYTNYSFTSPCRTSISSTAFRQRVIQLLSDLASCYELCDAISTNRRLGSTHESFDRLQDGLRASASSVQSKFNILRRVIGLEMDQGDEKAHLAMDISVRNLQTDVRAKLFEIAYKRRDRQDSAVLPGFKNLLGLCQMIEREVIDTIQSLGQRLEKEKVHGKEISPLIETYAVKPTVNEYEEQSENEQVTISLKDLDNLLNHMKNSWVEKWIAGEIVYINKFDAAKIQRERPNGYIKQLSRSPRASSVDSSRSSTVNSSRASSVDSSRETR